MAVETDIKHEDYLSSKLLLNHLNKSDEQNNKYCKAIEYKQYDLNNDSNNTFSVKLTRESDEIMFTHLVIECMYSADSNYKFQILDNLKSIYLKILGNTFFELDLQFITKLEEPIISENNIIIKLPYNYMFKPIKTVLLYCSNIFECIVDVNDSKFIKKISLLTELTYVNLEYRKFLLVSNKIKDEQIEFVQEFYSDTVNNPELKNKLTVKLSFKHIVKGYFFNINIKTIKNLVIRYNGDIIMNLNKVMLLANCKTIKKDDLYYLPYDSKYSFNDFSPQSYLGGVAHSGGPIYSSYHNWTFEFEFIIPTESFKIYTISANDLMYLNGLIGMRMSN